MPAGDRVHPVPGLSGNDRVKRLAGWVPVFECRHLDLDSALPGQISHPGVGIDPQAPGTGRPEQPGGDAESRSRRPGRPGPGWRRRSAPLGHPDSGGGHDRSVRGPRRTTPPPAGADAARSVTKLAAAGLRVALAYTNHRPQAGLAAAGFAPGEAEEGARLKRFELARRTRYGPAAKNVLISATTRRCSVSSGARWPPSIRTSRESGDQYRASASAVATGVDAVGRAVHDRGRAP